ncbi:biotin--[acetyl-CoA-carboxylase] ligase [Ignatzschineria ureiclastica]|uniref:biotin--[biotin carboxyl-carrier protein] ligase n=1 Tax=Ignatzschineria ureiclastica TaxID=472582 RepID=A0A2U2AF57_9GAMM|nr:biotin--[acetyl-CoA-carboxylase] ligase [Ignatzschineria ureiclastica]PWD81294.1 biotin--[acetyl-CoA-carboxylase] ligase [Ignatzschineria ureiclastica]GGZ97827.1 hypothetical protein GCM10007162_12540 [Ignatzschineria ureiclastica]
MDEQKNLIEAVEKDHAINTPVIQGASLLFPYLSERESYALPALLISHQIPLSLEQAIASSQWLAKQSTIFEFDSGHNGNLPPTITTLKRYQPLDEAEIRSYLPPIINQQCSILNNFITESTNADLLTLNVDSAEKIVPIAIAVAEMQQSGRGRREKQWISPLAVNLYFSLRVQFPLTAIDLLPSLSVRVGIILLDTLRNMGLKDIKLKWPNDIWYQSRKLAGILVETKITAQGIVVVIGIGVNNHQPLTKSIQGSQKGLNNNPIACEEIVGEPIDRNILVAALTTALYRLWQEVVNPDRNPVDITQIWPDKSYFYGQDIAIWRGDELYRKGREMGIDQDGALLVQTEEGLQRITSSEYSLRGQ